MYTPCPSLLLTTKPRQQQLLVVCQVIDCRHNEDILHTGCGRWLQCVPRVHRCMFSLEYSMLTYYRLDCSCTAVPAMQWRRVLSDQHPTKHRRFWQWRHLCPDQGSRKLRMGRSWDRLENERIQHVHHVPICRWKQRHGLSTLSLWT